MSRTCSKKCAYELGVKTRKNKGSYKRTEEQNKKLSKTLKEKYNPNTPDVIQKFVVRVKKMWETGEMKRKQEKTCYKKYGTNHHMKSPYYKEMFSKMFANRKISKETRIKMSLSAQKRVRTKRETLYTNANGGTRKDLGIYFRSNWEANFARILNYQNKEWEYEPISFTLSEGSYTPDFKVGEQFIEIKGKIEEPFKKKIKEFRKLYSHVNLCVIHEKEYRQLAKKYKKLIPNWEGK